MFLSTLKVQDVVFVLDEKPKSPFGPLFPLFVLKSIYPPLFGQGLPKP